MGQYNSKHSGSRVDLGIDFSHALSDTEIVKRNDVAEVTPTGKPLTSGSLVLEGTYYWDSTAGKVNIARWLTVGDTNTNPVVTLKEAGDRNDIHKSLREDYEEAHTITLVEGENTLAEYSTKHIVGEASEDVEGVTLIENGGSNKILRYVGTMLAGTETKYVYVGKGELLPKYFTAESDRSKITSLGCNVTFGFSGSDFNIYTATETYISAGADESSTKIYKIDAYDDLVVNEWENTSYPNYFAWKSDDGDIIYTSTMSPTTADKAKTGTVSWVINGTFNVKRDTYDQGITLKKGTVENMEDDTKLEEIKDGLGDTAKVVGSVAKTKDIGDINKLFTEAKENLVEAINEVEERVRVFTSVFDPIKEAKEGDLWISTNN